MELPGKLVLHQSGLASASLGQGLPAGVILGQGDDGERAEQGKASNPCPQSVQGTRTCAC